MRILQYKLTRWSEIIIKLFLNIFKRKEVKMVDKKDRGMYTFLWLILLGAVGVAIAGLVIALENQKKLKKESYHQCPVGKDGMPCSGHGGCVDGRCLCPQEWSGIACQNRVTEYDCPMGPDGDVCSGVGTCDHTTGKCICEHGYTGYTCQYGGGGWSNGIQNGNM